MAALDDESKRSALLEAVRKHRKVEDAAKAVGITGRTVRNYAAKHEDFRVALAVARRRAKIAAHHGTRLPATTRAKDAEELLGDGLPDLDASDPDEFLELVSRHANDGESKGCSKALEILDRWHNAEHYLALQAKAKRDAALLEAADGKDTRPVIIRHGAAPPRVVDAELIERPPRLDS